MQQLGLMGKALTILAALAALAGCYNPRFPSEDDTAAQDPPPDSIVRDRRDSAAGSGSSTRPD